MYKTIDIKRTTKKELIELIRKLKRQKDDHYILQENGKPLAVVISGAEYEELIEERRKKAAEELRKFLAGIHAKVDMSGSDEEVEKEIIEAIHELRGIKC